MATDTTIEKKGKKPRSKVKKVILRVLLVLLIVIALVVIAMFVSCRTSFTDPGITQAEVEAASAPTTPGGGVEALEALSDNSGGLYVSLHGFSWEQSTESFGGGETTEEDGAYSGTDVAQIQASYCTQSCHTDAELNAYKTDPDSALRDVQRMVDDYDSQISEEQVQALVQAYTK